MDLVLGFYNGYASTKTSKGGLYYCLKTFRTFNQSARVVVMAEHNAVFAELVELCHETNTEIYTAFSLMNECNLMYHRFVVYLQYITEQEKNGVVFRNVLLCDMDDLVFQDDPFTMTMGPHNLLAAPEQNMMLDPTNASSRTNCYWLATCGLVDFDIFANKKVICAGSIYGSCDMIKLFIETYIEILARNNGQANDQGFYNIFALDNADITDRILTLDRVPFESLSINEERIVNASGQPYAILHQINRCNLHFMLQLADCIIAGTLLPTQQ